MNDNRLDAAVVLSLIVLLGGVLLILAFVQIPKDNLTLFGSIGSGVVGAGIAAYIGYRWGSSKGSQAKDDAIATLTNKVADQ